MSRPLPAFAALVCAAGLLSIPLPAGADVTGAVRGTLQRADRAPLPAVEVTLTGERVRLSARTDAQGRFAFARVPFGHYDVHAAAGEDDASAALDVASDSVVDLALVARRRIGRTRATSTGVRGTPVSQNVLGPRMLATLPRNDSLRALVATVPGVVAFSYDEPVAHGFHGLTYELDGAPLPQSTSANLAQLVDPRQVSSIEIFTGAFPAEFGGSRQGAVVNIASAADSAQSPAGGQLSLTAGSAGTSGIALAERFDAGKARIAFSLDTSRSDRGLDTPARDARHDAAAGSSAFVRVTLPRGQRVLWAADLSAQDAAFQIPINTRAGDPASPAVSVPGSDDVQREYDRFASLSYTHSAKDGAAYVQVLPWVRSTRISYLGDAASDLRGFMTNPDGTVTPLNSLVQDRAATYLGVRASAFRAGNRHAVKAGLDLSREDLRSRSDIACAPGNCLASTFSDRSAQRGTFAGAYVEDKWTPAARTSIEAGLRYDHSTGYTGGAQLSPRLGVNQQAGNGTVVHAYYGRLYAAPGLEDTRRDAVLTQTTAAAAPVYDLQPERDTYVELGLAHVFARGVRGYLNAFDRTATGVLDTTNLANTPLFVVFNNSVGVARGLELRVTQNTAATDAALSLTYQRALAGGVSGSTFLLNGNRNDITLQPEDHDQTWAGSASYARRFGAELRAYASMQTRYGTGFPVAFENGQGRLPSHWLVDAAVGRTPGERSGLGWTLELQNLLDHRYPIKVNNGFNTTQWNAPRRVVLRLTQPW